MAAVAIAVFVGGLLAGLVIGRWWVLGVAAALVLVHVGIVLGEGPSSDLFRWVGACAGG
jgi:hypothetical protein